MASAIIPHCKLCKKSVPDKKERRNLSTPTTHLQIVKTCRNIDPLADFSSFGSGYVCKHCFLLCKRYSDTAANLHTLKETITSYLTDIPATRKRKLCTVPTTSKRFRTTADSPEVKITVEYTDYTQHFRLSPSRKKICKALGRRKRLAYVKHVVDDPMNRKYVIGRVKKLVRKEICALCSNRSLLVKTTKDDLTNFEFSKLHKEITTHAPILSSIISCCIPQCSNLSRDVITMVCISIICKSKRPSASLLQQFFSLCLYTGHCSKKGACSTLFRSASSLPSELISSSECVTPEQSPNNEIEAIFGSTILLSPPSLSPSSITDDSPHASPAFSYITSPDTSFAILSPQLECSGNISSSPMNSPLSLQPSLLQPVEPAVGNTVFASQPPDIQSFTLVLDNLDKHVKAFDMRMKHQSQSLHFVNTIAIVDRVDVSNLPSRVTPIDKEKIDLKDLLPSPDDNTVIKKNMSVLVSRILAEYMPCFQQHSKSVTRHIRHQYSVEMSKKSTVIVYGRLYKTSSSTDTGTLYQLRNLINRRNVVKDPSKDFNACEDFFLTVLTAHILTATMRILKMASLEDTPDTSIIPSDHALATPTEKKKNIEKVASRLVNDYVEMNYPTTKNSDERKDGVVEYAKEVLTLGCFYLEYRDAIREGDGKRALRCWKFMLLYCRATGHTNYANEALTLLSQYHYLLPPSLAVQLLQSRFVNTSGIEGRNIPADLHLEHLNRLCKDSISNLGANKTPSALKRVGKSSQVLNDLCAKFNEGLGLHQESNAHSVHSDLEDVQKIMDTLLKEQVLDSKSCDRNHKSFSNLTCNVFKRINGKKFQTWMKGRFNKLVNNSTTNR